MKTEEIVPYLVGVFAQIASKQQPSNFIETYLKLGFDERQAKLLSQVAEDYKHAESKSLFEREIEDRLNNSGLFDLRYYQERENNEDLTTFDDDLVEGMFITDWNVSWIRSYITEL